MDEIIITDDKLKHFNIGNADNRESSLLYNEKGLHTIVLSRCAENYRSAHPEKVNCVGESNRAELTIVLYTSGLLTKIVFRKQFYANPFYDKLLCGDRRSRFDALSDMIRKCGFCLMEL